MRIETYKKYRNDFLNQYDLLRKNELGFVSLKDFKIRNINKFLLIFSLDFKDSAFNNTVKSISPKQYFIGKRSVSSIKINSKKSFLDIYPEDYYKWIKYYFR
jgi:hypothetical protein